MHTVTSRPYPDLKTWRTANGLSQQKAADLLGLTQSKYSRLERRVTVLAGPEAKDIMDRTGVSLEVLVGAA